MFSPEALEKDDKSGPETNFQFLKKINEILYKFILFIFTKMNTPKMLEEEREKVYK